MCMYVHALSNAVAQHLVGTSESARADLTRRLERERREHQRLQRSLTRQAAEWVQIRKEMQEQDESRRWTTVRHSSHTIG